MNLDQMFILVFIRQNMFPDHQMVHTFHLGFLIGKAVEGYCQKRHTMTGHPSVLLFGCEGEIALHNAIKDLVELGIEYIEWTDPDSKFGHDDFGLTGIVSQPITKSQRNKLARYRAWTDRNNSRINKIDNSKKAEDIFNRYHSHRTYVEHVEICPTFGKGDYNHCKCCVCHGCHGYCTKWRTEEIKQLKLMLDNA